MGMFCFQCQEAAGGKGCTIQGVCGKLPQTAGLMDVLLYAVRGEAIVNRALREKGAPDDRASRQMIDALFSTITNANFDDDALKTRIAGALAMKNELIGTAKKRGFRFGIGLAGNSCRKSLFIPIRRSTNRLRKKSAC